MPLGQNWTRRKLLRSGTAAGMAWSCPLRGGDATTVFPVHFRKASPYEALRPLVEPGHDEFLVEKEAAGIAERWKRALDTRAVPLAKEFSGGSPMPARYKEVAKGTFTAEFDPADRGFQVGMKDWLTGLGEIRSARFFALAGRRLRYEIASTAGGQLNYRVGIWNQKWRGDLLAQFEPVEETLVTSPRPLFRDVTGTTFGEAESFGNQLLRGVPYWRARLDSASGIDVYGNNGIAVGDIDGDGRDEVYICQPGGLPNRLYKLGADGRAQDITERWGAGVLDDSTAALFLDLRNSGRQDLVVLSTSGPLLFLNDGALFRHKPDAFRFATPPQGTFTGMSAADYDRDGRVDLYLCAYVYFQSEDQYRYPAPYYDAQNGPPNFLFHNRLTADGAGSFEDVTAAAGLDENNNRYSFAPAWCDYNGDGWPDLYVANDFGRKNLYQNEGGHFRDVAAAAGVEDLGPGMSATWFDYDGDGRPDLYVSNMWTASGQRVTADAHFGPVAKDGLADAYRRHTKGNSLYRNRGDGTFEETEAQEGVEMGRWAWSADGFDLDNDGAPEIYIACGMLTNPSQAPPADAMSFFWRQVVANSPATQSPAPAYENGWNAINQFIREDYSWNGREPNVLYARRGGRYYDHSGVSGMDFADDSRAFAVTDFDGDGNLDVLLKSRLGPQVRLLRNEWGLGRRAFAVRLTGGPSNRDAIGAAVEVEWAGKRTIAFVQAGSGYLSQHTKTLHFGLGDASVADRIAIRWPSGLRQEFHNVEAGFRYYVTEGDNQLRREAFAQHQPLQPAPSVLPENRPGFEETWLLQPVPIPEQRRGPGFLLLTAGERLGLPAGIPGEVLDLSRESPDMAAGYALFRRYLFDYRTELMLPMLILIDERGLAHKVYPNVPAEGRLREDLQLMRDPDRARLALPFPGRYYAPRSLQPRRNYFRLGSAFFGAGYPEQALIYLGEAIRAQPDNGKAHLAVGFIHMEAGRESPARQHLERAVQLLPKSPDAWTYLGRLEMELNHYREALRDFEEALALNPSAPYALMSAGQARAALGDDAAAEPLFRRALASDSQDADAANQLGLLLVRHSHLDEARQCFQQAIAAKPDHVWAVNNLGVLYMQMQKVDDAVAAFRYGIQIAPDEETSYLNLARVYARAGDRAKAREVLQQLRLRKPDSAAGAKALRELQE
jgi:tetratricopeptide (TPR) repeat protein